MPRCQEEDLASWIVVVHVLHRLLQHQACLLMGLGAAPAAEISGSFAPLLYCMSACDPAFAQGIRRVSAVFAYNFANCPNYQFA